MRRRARSHRYCRQRGVALLLVLFAVTVSAALALSFLSSQSTTLGIARNLQDHSRARYVAESGLALTLAYVRANGDWRTVQSHGTWVTDEAFGAGTFTVVGEDGVDTDGDGVVDGDGDLSDDTGDSATITVTGTVGGATHTVKAQIVPIAGSGIYWAEADTEKIQRSALDGSGVNDLVSEMKDVRTLELDTAAGKMYWSDDDSKKLQRANLTGSGAEDLVGGLNHVLALKLDPKAGKVYWSEKDSMKIQRANLDGSNVEDLVTGVSEVLTLALDVPAGKMYWSNKSTKKLQRANLDGSGVEDLVTNLEEVRNLAVFGGKVYWTEDVTGKLQRANVDGSNVEDLVTSLQDVHTLELEALSGKLYWTNNDTQRLQRANLDGSNVENLVTGLTDVRNLALDASGGKVYWTDKASEKLQRANTDGSDLEDLVTDLVDVTALALDSPSGGAVYCYSCNTQGTDVFAYASAGGGAAPTSENVPGGGDVLAPLEYDALEVEDGVFHAQSASSTNDHVWQRFEIIIDEPIESITQIEIRWVGKGVNANNGKKDGAALYIWNYAGSGAFELLASSADTESVVTINGSVATGLSDYVGSGSQVSILVSSADKKSGNPHTNTLYTDYIAVAVRTSGSGGGAGGGYTAQWTE